MKRLEELKLKCENLMRTREIIMDCILDGDMDYETLENHDSYAGDSLFELHCVELLESKIEASYDSENPNGTRYLEDSEYELYLDYLA